MSARWRLRSRAIDEITVAEDQFTAWDTLAERDVMDFGLVVTAEPDESGDPIPVQTEMLMRRWGRANDADAFHALAVQHDLAPAAETGEGR